MASSPEKTYELALLLDLYGALLSDRQREVCDLCYNDDLSLAEAADECGISRQGVRDALLKAEASLWHYERALGLLEKQKRNDACMETVLKELARLKSAGCETAGLERALAALTEGTEGRQGV